MGSDTRHDDADAHYPRPYVLLSREETALPALPLFALDHSNRRRTYHLLYETRLAQHHINATLRWQVSADPAYGFPDAFDRRIFKTIEYLAMQAGLPVRNPVRVSLHQILECLGLAPFGSHFARVRSSIRRIAAVSIHSHMTFLTPQNTGRLARTFHLHDTVSFREDIRADEVKPGHHVIMFGAWYLDNLNQQIIPPIDPRYFRTLHNPLASRLYELLTLKFKDVFQRNLEGWQVPYPVLCETLPLKPFKWLSPKRQLEPAHHTLISTGFLERVEWDKLDGVWLIRYTPGDRARQTGRLQSAAAPPLRSPEGF